MPTNRTEGRNGDGDSFPAKVWRNFGYATRRLRQRPGFTAIAILSLAVGIGANTAIFTLINAVLLKKSPLKAPEELVNLYIDTPDFHYNVFSYPDYEDIRDGTRDVFEGVSATRINLVQVDRDGSVEMLLSEVVTGNYFSLLGVEALVGRTILPEDDVNPGAHPVAVLSHKYWLSALGGDPTVVGREMRLSGRPYTILGIAPPEFMGSFRGMEPAVYAPMMMLNELLAANSDQFEARGNHSMFLKARLKPGVSIPQVQVAMDAVAARLTEADTDNWNLHGKFISVPTESVILFPPFDRFVRAAAWLLTVAVGLVLLIACMNLASFLLAQALDRKKEIALRLALGATRRDLVGQLLSETVILGVLAGGAGFALSVWLLKLLVSADLPLPLPITLDLTPDTNVLGFSLTVSLVAGVLLGLVPALQSTNPDLASTLKDETAGGGQHGKITVRNLLVVAQVVVSLVLLVGAGLFLRSFAQIQSVDPGFGREPSAILTIMVPTTRFTEEEGRVFTRTLLSRFREIPGVESVGVIDNLHLNTTSTQTMNFNVTGVEPPPERDSHSADRATVDPEFFEAAGVRILRGRNFNDRDLADRPPVAIVSEALAKKFWSSAENAIGKMLIDEDDPDIEVVGVASDTKVRSLGEAPRSFIYIPHSQNYTTFHTVVARTTLDPDRLALDLMATGRRVDPDLWVWEAKSMDNHLGIVLLPARLSALLLSVFAVLALALASVGLYGIVSYAVAQRTREVGIRMSLGADSGSVIRMLMQSGLKLVAVGGAIGLLLSFGLSRLLSGLLFGVEAFDPFTFFVVPTVLVAAAVLAAYVPARRASRIDPVVALRTE